MPWSSETHDDSGAVVLRASETLTPADLDELLAGAGRGLVPGAGLRLLADFREVSRVDAAYPDVRALTERLVDLCGCFDDGQVAVVAGSDHVFGLARMFELLSETVACRVRAFRDFDAAVDWLGLSPVLAAG